MPRFSRLRVQTTMIESGLVPIFYHPSAEVVLRAVDGVVAGGSAIFEYTNRGDGALRVFERVLERCRAQHPDLLLGVGSIVDPHVGALYLAAGADFVVSPTLDRDLVRLCNLHRVTCVPGCGSVTEIAEAEALGCELVKLFPAGGLGGPGFIKAVLGPRPWCRIVPTGGVSPDEDNIRGWIEAGAACVGMGGKLFDKRALEQGEDPSIAKKVADVLRWIKAARGAQWTL